MKEVEELYEGMWVRNNEGRGDSKCNGPQAGSCLPVSIQQGGMWDHWGQKRKQEARGKEEYVVPW